MRSSTRDIIALNMAEGIGPVKGARLLDSNKYPAEADRVKRTSCFQEELRYIEKEGIRAVTLLDEDYPGSLKNIFDPPLVLFYKGEIRPEDKRAVAIVGARKCTAYGMRIAERLASDLASRGVPVISGLARGIDLAAHRGALRAGGRTIAVMGSGFGSIYPREAAGMVSRIEANGAVVTEYSSGIRPDRFTFPRRNRIISGLAQGVIVVEAAKKSGALITADFALEHGKEVFAVPGSADSVMSAGTNRLIQDGAKLVTCADDVLEELPGIIQDKRAKEEEPLAGDEFAVISAIKKGPSGHIDLLAEETGFEHGYLTKVLLDLELKGKVKAVPGARYSL